MPKHELRNGWRRQGPAAAAAGAGPSGGVERSRKAAGRQSSAVSRSDRDRDRMNASVRVRSYRCFTITPITAQLPRLDSRKMRRRTSARAVPAAP